MAQETAKKSKAGTQARDSEKTSRKSSRLGVSKKARAKRPDLRWEKSVGFPTVLVAGVDEVGRGCLAGPVVAGAVLLPSEVDYKAHPWLRDIADSKLLDEEERERLAPLIESWVLSFAVGVASVSEIDQINIYHASHLAMRRAIQGLAVAPKHILVDGKFVPKDLPCDATAIVKGDLKCLSIAAASIIAKVWRDRHMKEQDTKFPGYDFGVHKGYATPAHQAALRARGICEIHRKSFEPIALLSTPQNLELF